MKTIKVEDEGFSVDDDFVAEMQNALRKDYPNLILYDIQEDVKNVASLAIATFLNKFEIKVQ